MAGPCHQVKLAAHTHAHIVTCGPVSVLLIHCSCVVHARVASLSASRAGSGSLCHDHGLCIRVHPTALLGLLSTCRQALCLSLRAMPCYASPSVRASPAVIRPLLAKPVSTLCEHAQRPDIAPHVRFHSNSDADTQLHGHAKGLVERPSYAGSMRSSSRRSRCAFTACTSACSTERAAWCATVSLTHRAGQLYRTIC
jgi:hypothetical protein